MIKVLLAEDMHMIREALVALLDLEPDIEVVGQASVGTQIVPLAKEHEPDVAVVDVDLPELDGLTAVAEMHEVVPQCRTLVLTSFGHPGTVRRALDARVRGYLLKDAPAHRLVSAIREIAVGRRVIDSELAMNAWDTDRCPLSRRELEILRLMSSGHDVDQIADDLCLSVGTVRNYLTSLVTKMDARNRVDAIRIATESGWL